MAKAAWEAGGSAPLLEFGQREGCAVFAGAAAAPLMNAAGPIGTASGAMV